jgi:hypothetical protein
MRAFTKWNGEPKSHRRPRTCEHCRENPKGACILPFRQVTQVRKWKLLDMKPTLPVWKIRTKFNV